MNFPIDDPKTTTPAMADRVATLTRELANIDTLLDFAQAEPQLFGGYDQVLHAKVRAAVDALTEPLAPAPGVAAGVAPWIRAGLLPF